MKKIKKQLTIFKQGLIDKLKKKEVKRALVALTVLLVLYLGFVNYTEPTELGIARNVISGKMWIQKGGIHFSFPWVWVACADTRPTRVAVTSAGRGYSAKLIQFNKDAWREFVTVEGWHYYWLANRISFNLGYDEEYRGMRDIMRGYAYSAKGYQFIVVLEEYQEK